MKSRYIDNQVVKKKYGLQFNTDSYDILTDDEFMCFSKCMQDFQKNTDFLFLRNRRKTYPKLKRIKSTNADSENIRLLYNGFKSNRKLYNEFANHYILSINNELIETDLNFYNFQVCDFSSTDESYRRVINDIIDVFYYENITWFLKIIGHAPTNEQLELIEELIEKRKINDKLKEIQQDFSKKIDELSLNLNGIAILENNINAIKEQINNFNSCYNNISAQIEENSSKINDITKNLSDINNSINRLNNISYEDNDIQMLENGYKTLSEDVLVLKEQFNILQKSRELVEKCTQKVLDNIPKDLNMKEKSLIVVTPMENYPENSNNLTDINDCINDLSENFSFLIPSWKNDLKVSNMYAKYILSIMCNGNIPLICGYGSREISNIISLTISSQTPEIISLPNGYSNSNELISMWESSKSNIILIEDAIGTMNERTLMPLLRKYRCHTDKNKPFIILSCEDTDSLKYIPKNILNYVTLVCFACYMNFIDYSNEKLYKSNSIEYIKTYTYSNKIQQKMRRIQGLDKSYIHIKSNILSYFDTTSANILLNSELKYILDSKNFDIASKELSNNN